MSSGEILLVVAAVYAVVFFVHVISDAGQHATERK
jgi:hypothetical protein